MPSNPHKTREANIAKYIYDHIVNPINVCYCYSFFNGMFIYKIAYEKTCKVTRITYDSNWSTEPVGEEVSHRQNIEPYAMRSASNDPPPL